MDDYSPSYRGKPGTWCRGCFANYNRARKHGAATPPSLPPQLPPRSCAFCGASYLSKQNQPSMFCSRECKANAHKAALAAALLASKPSDRICVWCGSAMAQSMRIDAKFCSADCNMQAHRRTRNLRRRLGASAPVKPRLIPLLNLAQFAADHGHICGLCGVVVDMALHHPDPMCPSIDHITPRSLGGGDEIANLQLSHLVCNLRKRAVTS